MSEESRGQHLAIGELADLWDLDRKTVHPPIEDEHGGESMFNEGAL